MKVGNKICRWKETFYLCAFRQTSSLSAGMVRSSGWALLLCSRGSICQWPEYTAFRWESPPATYNTSIPPGCSAFGHGAIPSAKIFSLFGKIDFYTSFYASAILHCRLWNRGFLFWVCDLSPRCCLVGSAGMAEISPAQNHIFWLHIYGRWGS